MNDERRAALPCVLGARRICRRYITSEPRVARAHPGQKKETHRQTSKRFYNTGPGIPKEEIPKVLSAFGQGSLAHTSAEGGTGLGLPIVRSLIELHGGKLDITSAEGEGTTVSISVPLVASNLEIEAA